MAVRTTKLIEVQLEDTKLSTFILLIQTVDAINKYTDICFYKEGLSQIKFIVLTVLSLNGGTMTPSDIARWTFRERHNITTLIRRLERDGLVSIERSSTDRRSVHVTLTEKGEQVRSRVVPLARNIMEQMMSSLADRRITGLGECIRVLKHNVEHGLEHC